MERSSELEAVTRRWIEAMRAGELDLVNDLMSSRDEVLFIGTDPAEEWWGRDTVSAVLATQLEELGGELPIALRTVHSWTEGTVGWSYVTVDAAVGGHRFETRYVAIFHREADEWRVVTAIGSIPVTNEEALGVTLTTSLDRVANAVTAERPDLGPATPSEGAVTLLFTDIEGSTERTNAVGDGPWMNTLRRHNQILRRQIALNDGFEVKSLGDGFMVAFASAARALRCAQGMQSAMKEADDLDVRVRVGLHAGEVVREGNDFYGGVVNMAARVAGQAQGGEVLVSSPLRELVEPSGIFGFTETRTVALKGFDGEHVVHSLLLQ